MVPNIFGTRGQFHEDNFFMGWSGEDGFKMIQAHCIYCALYFSYHYISSTSGHQTLDPGVCVCACVHLVLQLCLTLCNPVDSSPPGSFVHGDSPGKNTGEGKNICPPPEDLPNPGIESRSPTLQADSLPYEPPGKPCTNGLSCWLGSPLRHHCGEKYGLP